MKEKLIAMTMSAMMLLPVIAVAGEFPNEATPGNDEPQLYLIKKIFDICNPADDQQEAGVCVVIPPWDNDPNNALACAERTSGGEAHCEGYAMCDWVEVPLTPGELLGTGGSTPYGDQTIQYGGCKDTVHEKRYNQYAFSGEQILELVVVRDLNGAEDLIGADVTVDGYLEAKCDDVTGVFWFHGALQKTTWFGHDVETLLETIPPSKGPADPEGFDPTFDRLYECILTVEPSWYGMSVVNIEARDQSGSVSTDAIAQTWFFNPAVILDLDTNDGAPAIWYEDGVPGQTVYSGNKLVITNLAEGGVDLLVFIAADDLTDPTHFGAKCPVSNVLDVDVPGINQGMEYNCKIGTLKDNEWNDIHNKNTKLECNGEVVLDPNWYFGDDSVCYGATALLTEHLPILMNIHEAECQFRLTYPIPCIGSFTEGLIHIIVRAI